MNRPIIISELDWPRSPLETMASWPADEPLLMLHSGRVHPQWARWSIFASPVGRYQFDGRSRWVGQPPDVLSKIAFTHDPLVDLDAILAATRQIDETNEREVPFIGGWIGCFSYDLGRWIEPRAQMAGGAHEDCRWPLIDLAWCSSALLFDHLEERWLAVGSAERFINGDDPRTRSTLPSGLDIFDFEMGTFKPHISREKYMAMVQRTIEYIAAGDIFQANMAQRFTAPFEGSARALAASLFESARPWYGAYLELPGKESIQGSGATGRADRPDPCTCIKGRTHGSVAARPTRGTRAADLLKSIISLSPELFLQYDPRTRRIITRPIKGTRPGSAHADSLSRSAKDAAELHMIVDLMRNDLGRVCEFGSVRVPQPRLIESHPTVLHGVGEVTGTLRRGATFGDVLRATFPGGSVTGAPKIRAMQIIDELEPMPRGPYCGAIGFVSDSGAFNLNIAIRTLLVSGQATGEAPCHVNGTVDYSAGAGIVADSDPLSEYRETLDKTTVVRGSRKLKRGVHGEQRGAVSFPRKRESSKAPCASGFPHARE